MTNERGAERVKPRPGENKICRHELRAETCSMCCGPYPKHRNERDHPQSKLKVTATFEAPQECMAGGDYITPGDTIVPFHPGWAHKDCLREAQLRAEAY